MHSFFGLPPFVPFYQHLEKDNSSADPINGEEESSSTDFSGTDSPTESKKLKTVSFSPFVEAFMYDYQIINQEGVAYHTIEHVTFPVPLKGFSFTSAPELSLFASGKQVFKSEDELLFNTLNALVQQVFFQKLREKEQSGTAIADLQQDSRHNDLINVVHHTIDLIEKSFKRAISHYFPTDEIEIFFRRPFVSKSANEMVEVIKSLTFKKFQATLGKIAIKDDETLQYINDRIQILTKAKKIEIRPRKCENLKEELKIFKKLRRLHTSSFPIVITTLGVEALKEVFENKKLEGCFVNYLKRKLAEQIQYDSDVD